MRCWTSAVDPGLLPHLPRWERWRFTLIAVLTLLIGAACAHAGYSFVRDFAGLAIATASGALLAFIALNLLRLIYANCAPSPSLARRPANPEELAGERGTSRSRQTLVMRLAVAGVVSLSAVPALATRILGPQVAVLEASDIRGAIEVESSLIRERYRGDLATLTSALALTGGNVEAMRRRQAELLQPQLLARMPEATRRRVQTTVDATRDELEQRIRSERLRLQPRIDSLTNALRGLDEQQNREIAAIASRTEFQPSFSRRAVLMYRRIWYSYPLSFALGALFLLPVWMRLRGEYLYDRLVAAEGYRTVARSHALFLRRFAHAVQRYPVTFAAPFSGFSDAPFNTQPLAPRLVPLDALIGDVAERAP